MVSALKFGRLKYSKPSFRLFQVLILFLPGILRRRLLVPAGTLQMSRLVRALDDKEVVERLRSSVKRAGGQSAFAKQAGVDRTHLNYVLNGKRPPSWSIIDALNLGIVYVALDRYRYSCSQAATAGPL
jgi:hypothetical protein